METLTHSLAGLGNFALYFILSLVLLLIFHLVYVRFTPFDEWKLVKEQKNTAAAITLSGSILGYSLALASAASNSVNLIDFCVWGVVALIAQILAFVIVRVGFMPKLVARIEAGEIPAAILMAATSVAVGILNAACMTY
jgi:putative membrane protein